MVKCEYCNKEHDSSFQSGRFCNASCKALWISKKHGGKVKCHICNKDIHKNSIKRHLRWHEKQEKNKNKLHICENCHEEFKGDSLGKNRFCSPFCSHSFVASQNKKSRVAKISNSAKINFINKKSGECLDKKTSKRYVNKKYKEAKIKQTICKSCDEIIENTNCKKYCDECKKFINYDKMFKKLNINESNVKIASNLALKVLKEEYFKNNLSLIEIRKKYKIQYNTIFNFFNKFNIRLRDLKQASLLAYEEGRNIVDSGHGEFKYCKQGWHETWDGNKVYLRSSNEFKYAKELDSLKIKYEVEFIKIRYYDSVEKKERISITDFYLPYSNMIVEIKSMYTLDIQNMKDRLKAYKELDYNYKVIVDDEEILFEIN